jgi:hypothetical protein
VELPLKVSVQPGREVVRDQDGRIESVRETTFVDTAWNGKRPAQLSA